jgi:MFS family permease
MLVIFVGLGFCSSAKGIYLNPILEHTGLSAGLFGFSDTFRYLTTSVVNIFFGTLIAKLGIKKLVGAGFLSLVISMVLYAFSTTLIGFYLAGAFLGLGLAWCTTTMIGYIVRKWESKNRGTVMGIILAINGFGSSLATIVFTPLLNASATGYKTAYLITALIVFVVGVIAVIFLKDKKVDTAEVQPQEKKRGDNWIGIDRKTAFKKKYFYLVMICIFLTGVVIQSITGVFIRHIQKVGVNQTFQSIIIPVSMIILSLTKFLTGFMYDKRGLRFTITINLICSIIAMVTISLVDTSVLGMVLCVIYVITANVALPLETIMLPIYAGDLFGEKDYNKMLGYIVSINTLGYAVGSPLMGFVFDIFNSYVPGFIVGAILMAITLIVMQYVISEANNVKK